jgi:hypothetical protein
MGGGEIPCPSQMKKIKLNEVGNFDKAHKVINIIVREFGITFDEMFEQKPSNHHSDNYEMLTTARWLALSLVSNFYTLAATSAFIGRNDHTAALNAKRKLDKRLKSNTQAREKVVKVLQSLNELLQKQNTTN